MNIASTVLADYDYGNSIFYACSDKQLIKYIRTLNGDKFSR